MWGSGGWGSTIDFAIAKKEPEWEMDLRGKKKLFTAAKAPWPPQYRAIQNAVDNLSITFFRFLLTFGGIKWDNNPCRGIGEWYSGHGG